MQAGCGCEWRTAMDPATDEVYSTRPEVSGLASDVEAEDEEDMGGGMEKQLQRWVTAEDGPHQSRRTSRQMHNRGRAISESVERKTATGQLCEQCLRQGDDEDDDVRER